MKIFCVIPAYNESKTIRRVVLDCLKKTSDIVIVDDCSKDNTLEVINDLNIYKIKHFINRGQGAALRTGTKLAIQEGADIIFHFDGDGQFLIKDIDKILEPLLNNRAEIVFGSRFLDNTTKMPFFKKNITMPLAKLVNRVFLGVKLTDPQCGLRAFKADIFNKINWDQDRMAHCSEILHLACKNKLKIQEVPITVIYNNHGQRFSGGLKILKELFFGRLLN